MNASHRDRIHPSLDKLDYFKPSFQKKNQYESETVGCPLERTFTTQTLTKGSHPMYSEN